MDPLLEEKQNNQPQQKRPTGESTINTINNLAGARNLFKNPLGKIGSKVVLQVGTRTLSAFLASPPGLVLIVIAVIFISTIIIIVGFGSAPASETIIPTIEPTQTETVTPTPAGP